MSVASCQTFLLTLQEPDTLVDLFTSVHLQAQNPEFLGPNWQEIQELTYNFRQTYQLEANILELLLQQDPKKDTKKPDARVQTNKIQQLNLDKNLEITQLYWQYHHLGQTLVQLSSLKNSNSAVKLFFGQNLDSFLLNFQNYIASILDHINNTGGYQLDINNQTLTQLTLSNLVAKPTGKLASLANWQVLKCPAELAGDLVIFAKDKQNYQSLKSTEIVDNQEATDEVAKDNLGAYQNTYAGQSLLDFDDLSILLQQQKFELQKRLQAHQFPIIETENLANQPLLDSQKQFFCETLARIRLEQKLNFYRFQVKQNLPEANYTKSQIVLTGQNLPKPAKPNLSFLIVSLPTYQLKDFFALIKPYPIAFAEIVPSTPVVFWQIKPPVIKPFLASFIQLAPVNNKQDPSFIFWQFLILNTAITIADLGTGLVILVLTILAYFHPKFKDKASTLGLLGIQSSFFGLLTGSVWANLAQKSSWLAGTWPFLQNFQLINLWDIAAKAPLNQLFGLNSSIKLIIASFILFILLGCGQLIWTFFQNPTQSKTSKISQRFANQISFGFYLILAIIFIGQIWASWFLHEKVSTLWWLPAQLVISGLALAIAWWVSLQINHYFLLPRFYQPTALQLKPERDSVDGFKFE